MFRYYVPTGSIYRSYLDLEAQCKFQKMIFDRITAHWYTDLELYSILLLTA